MIKHYRRDQKKRTAHTDIYEKSDVTKEPIQQFVPEPLPIPDSA